MEPPRAALSQPTELAPCSEFDSILHPGDNGAITQSCTDGRGSNDGAGRRESLPFSETSPSQNSGSTAAVSLNTLPALYIPVDSQVPTGSDNPSGQRSLESPSTAAVQAVRAPNKQRSCMSTLKERSIRRRLYTLIPSTIFLIAAIAFYLAINSATRLGQEIHILLIFMILILSIIFCHSLIRFAMTVLRDPGSGVARNRIPSRAGPMGYAQPARPIHVILAGDEEALVGSEGHLREKVTAPPPAYGLWRSSVRLNPDLLYWQRREGDERPDTTIDGTGRRQNNKAAAPRPPSYASDDGVEYVIEAQPRPFSARHDAERAGGQ
ncbi:uncharacterized protein ACLA_065240 [Aspergillus clavatus NRRL 1]|uniref:Uncharacterized protein n=1 Tax=Aspergillus clavatus (strain ATCC 1007 / CBS 513.65 / DSM 816 / NCTC 3887 / NRRL 1 / QM 1276 / 107) TaxID=344612 RepID=A1CG10_ASPCL|nr:uncharacterized protein ACLA_065240 [Aspergillus clavatus NRRL 1]EAW10890.1 hypothetical protein ACLA_065240 [Aspergillus clavatus NRRL 1]